MVKARRENGTGNIRPDTSRAGAWQGRRWTGSWIGTVQIDGRRYAARGKSKTDVAAKLSRRSAEALTGTGRSSANHDVTVADAINTFLERDLPNRKSGGRPLAPGSVENYRYNLEVVKKELGTVRLPRLTVVQVEDMLDRLATREIRPLSKASLAKLLSMFATVIDAAQRRDVVTRNVARLAALPADAKRTTERNALAPDDARKLLSAIRHERNGAMWALSLRLGLRPGEAAGLHWEDVDLANTPPTVNVTRGLQRARGTVNVSDNLKTSKAKRTIELPSDLVDWLAEHRRQQAAERLASSHWEDDRLVFASPNGRVVDPARARRRLAAICAKADIPAVTPNELRHSCASLLSDDGVPIERIADLLGHTTTRMVEQTYRHRVRPVIDVAARHDWLANAR